MPKSIIREFDNSTTGSSLATNFSVFIPGYMLSSKNTDALKKEAEKEGIYYSDSQIYKLNSKAQFLKYIGQSAGRGSVAVPPTFVALNPVASLDSIERYRKRLALNQICDSTTGAAIVGRRFYTGVELASTDARYNKEGFDEVTKKLYKNFVTTVDNTPTTVTYCFTEVSWGTVKSDYDTVVYNGVNSEEEENSESETVEEPTTSNAYFVLDGDKFGQDAQPDKSDCIGNQMAWELLNLGYTVYYKPLSEEVVEGTVIPAATQLAQPEFWEALRNKSTYQIRYLSSGGCYDPNVARTMVDIARFASNEKAPTVEQADTYGNATGRGDCIALLDIDENSSPFTSGDNNLKTKSGLLKAFGDAADLYTTAKCKYSAIFAPRVAYKLSYPEGSVYSAEQLFPASFHYLACAIQAQERYAEWYAVAGYQRGISPYTIEYTTYNFGDIDINTLAPRVENSYTKVAINLILNERGSYYLWGNRTAQALDKEGLIFSHFLNIRQLCCTVKQVIFAATRKFTFDPNSDLLWINFCNAIRPTLETMKGDQGIRGYSISKVATDKKALLVARIRIVPIEAVEDFDISIYLEDSLSGIVVSADETVAED